MKETFLGPTGDSKTYLTISCKNFVIIPCILTELNCSLSIPTYALLIYKGKVFPLHARGGPEGW